MASFMAVDMEALGRSLNKLPLLPLLLIHLAFCATGMNQMESMKRFSKSGVLLKKPLQEVEAA